MQESYSEGLAIHTDLESCGDAGNDIPEALTGVHAGWVLNRKSIYNQVRLISWSTMMIMHLL